MRRTFVLLLLLAACCAAACTAQPQTTPVVNSIDVPVRLLESWLPQEDTLTAQDAARAWRFNGQQGDALVLSVAAKDDGDVALVLQDSAGNALAQGDDLRFTLPADGIYTALVTLGTGDAATYRVTLGYTDRPAPTLTPSQTPTASWTPTQTLTPTPSQTLTASPTYTPSTTPTPVYAALGTLTGQLVVGEQVTGTYLSQFERHIYLFSGTSDQQVTIAMSGMSGTVDPVLTLFDPSGQPVATDDNSGGDRSALLRDIRLPVTGEYVIQALGGGTGTYNISLQADAPPRSEAQPTATPTPPSGTITPVAAVEELADHVLALGMIERPGSFDRYFLQAQAGDFLTVGVSPAAGSALLPRVEIYTPGGELLFITTLANGIALVPSLPVGESGKYAVFVNDAGRAGGAYTIAYGEGTTLIDNLRGSLTANTPAVGSGLLNVRDQWTLPLAAGDVIAVEALGAALEVIAPDGSALGMALGTLEFSVPASGDYRVYVSGGNYSLSWRYIAAAPTPAAPLLILSADDPLPAQTYLTYPFQALAGQRVHIRVEAQSAGVDPVAEVLDPAGVSVGNGDDSPNSLDPDFEARMPVDGTYRLRISDYSSTGGMVNVTIEMLS